MLSTSAVLCDYLWVQKLKELGTVVIGGCEKDAEDVLKESVQDIDDTLKEISTFAELDVCSIQVFDVDVKVFVIVGVCLRWKDGRGVIVVVFCYGYSVGQSGCVSSTGAGHRGF